MQPTWPDEHRGEIRINVLNLCLIALTITATAYLLTLIF
jgi:hypothetical protein